MSGPTKRNLDELICELEKAEGGSRELDAAVWECFGNCSHRETKYYAVQSDTGFKCVSCGIDMYGVKIPPSTTDLNAVLALVEKEQPGSVWTLEKDACWLRVQTEDDVAEYQGHKSMQSGRWTCLAVCVALLKSIKDQDHE